MPDDAHESQKSRVRATPSAPTILCSARAPARAPCIHERGYVLRRMHDVAHEAAVQCAPQRTVRERGVARNLRSRGTRGLF